MTDIRLSEKRLSQERSYFVVKANDLITKTRYSLTTQQHRVLLYFISRIKPDDEPETVYEMRISDFADICGYNMDGGYYYEAIKRDIKTITDTSCWIQVNANGDEELFRWFDRVRMSKKNGTVRITFHSTVSEYLFHLVERTGYNSRSYYYMLGLKKYSSRLYEILCVLEYRHRGYVEMEIEELKRRVDAESYTHMGHLKERVIEPAIMEINEYSDIIVDYDYKRTGRKITHIIFNIREKQNMEMAIQHRMLEGVINEEVRKERKEIRKRIEARREQIRMEDLEEGINND